MQFRSALILPSLTLCLFAFSGACSGGDSDGTGGSGGGGGKGGAGGKGGSGAGGSTPSTGGMGGSGGSAPSTGGTGGSAGGAPGAAPTPIGEFAFFSGKTMEIEKLSPTAEKGYLYAAPPLDTTVTPIAKTIVEVPTDPKLPAGIKYAYKVVIPKAYPEPNIIGWNWIADKSMGKFDWFDAKQFAGFSYWAKIDQPIWGPSVIAYDFASLGTMEYGGGCAMERCASLSTLPENALVNRSKGWTRIVVRFKDLVPGTMGTPTWDSAKFGRVDLLEQVQPTRETMEVLITGIELLKEDKLPPPVVDLE